MADGNLNEVIRKAREAIVCLQEKNKELTARIGELAGENVKLKEENFYLRQKNSQLCVRMQEFEQNGEENSPEDSSNSSQADAATDNSFLSNVEKFGLGWKVFVVVLVVGLLIIISAFISYELIFPPSKLDNDCPSQDTQQTALIPAEDSYPQELDASLGQSGQAEEAVDADEENQTSVFNREYSLQGKEPILVNVVGLPMIRLEFDPSFLEKFSESKPCLPRKKVASPINNKPKEKSGSGIIIPPPCPADRELKLSSEKPEPNLDTFFTQYNETE